MDRLTFLAFSLRDWITDVGEQLHDYFQHMNTTQYGIVATATVVFGFLCLRGHQIRR